MNLINTIKTGWRDLVAGIALTLALSFVADVLERLAIRDDGSVWIANVVLSLRGLSAFAGANLAAFFMVAVAWPTVNKFSNDSFTRGWESLTDGQKLTAFIAVSLAYLIAASICFAP